MSEANKLYTNATVYLDSALLSEQTSVTIKWSSGSTPVKTAGRGYSGESPGSAMCEITISAFVPADYFEYNPGVDIQLLAEKELTIFAGGSTLTSKGFIVEASFAKATDSEAKLDFSFRGGYASFE